MAYEVPGVILGTLTAASSGYTGATYQYRVVTISSGTKFKIQTAVAITDFALGILQDRPALGEAGNIMVSGVSKARVLSTASKAIVVGDKLRCSTAGGVMASTGNHTAYVLGRALTALSSGTTGIISMLITHQGRPSTAVKGGV